MIKPGEGLPDPMARSGQKVVTLDELAAFCAEQRTAGRRIVQCHGVFDILHPGHVIHLEDARRRGDALVVTLTPDRFVGKGPGRPLFGERLRAATMAALECVERVAINQWPTAVEALGLLRPAVYAKGAEYAAADADATGQIGPEVAAARMVGAEVVFTGGQVYRSSAVINRALSRYPPATDAYLEALRARRSPREVEGLLDALRALRVMVVGEAIVDEYCYCTAVGKASKDSIISARYGSEEWFAGGALAIANHLAGFCADVTLVTGLHPGDRAGAFARQALAPTVSLVEVGTEDRPTIRKRRYADATFAGKLFEVQVMDDRPLPERTDADLRRRLSECVPGADLVVVADFGHGLLGDGAREILLAAHAFIAVNAQSNSANLGFNPVTKYQRADYVCLHEGEVRIALRRQFGDLEDLAKELQGLTRAPLLMVTHGPTGSLLFTGSEVVRSPSLAVRVVDRTGAGDAVFAVTAACAARGAPPDLLGFIGNCVGALAVEIVGNRAPVDSVVLRKFATQLLV